MVGYRSLRMINAVESKHSFPIVIDYIDKLPSSVLHISRKNSGRHFLYRSRLQYGLDSEV